MKKLSTIFITLLVILSSFSTALAFDGIHYYENSQDLPSKIKTVTEEAEAKAVLPAKYDLRDVEGKNYIGPIRNQLPWRTCWSFAASDAARASTMLKGAENPLEFSPKALAWFAYSLQGSPTMNPSEYEGILVKNSAGNTTLPYDQGGNLELIMGQTTSWLGASSEEQAPYINSEGQTVPYYFNGVPMTIPSGNGDWSLNYDAIYNQYYRTLNADFISGYFYYPEYMSEDYLIPKIKGTIRDEGPVIIGYYARHQNPYYNEATAAQYYPTRDLRSNHCVTIVGWDDDYPVSNFNPENQPPGPGAFIVRNSWGPEWGDGGYFYLSYYDQSITGGVCLDVESDDTGYTYDHIYQHDYLGTKSNVASMVNNTFLDFVVEHNVPENAWKYANVFTATRDEILTGVSAYLGFDTQASVQTDIYLLDESGVDGRLVDTQKDVFYYAGIRNIKVDNPVRLKAGDKYVVVQTMNYTWETETSYAQNFPVFNLEFGYDKPRESYEYDVNGYPTDTVFYEYSTVHVDPGTSYIYGIGNLDRNSEDYEPDDKWYDLTDPELNSALTFETYLINKDTGERELNTVRPGNCMIKAYTVDYSDVETELSVSPEGPIEVTVNDSVQLTATVSPEDVPVMWSSDDVTVAQVINDGIVEGIGPGTTTIRATAGTSTVEVQVTVAQPAVSISPNYVNLAVGPNARETSAGLTATLTNPEEAGTLTWSIDNPNVATVTGDGATARVEALSDGQAIVTATLESGASANAVISVNSSPIIADLVYPYTPDPDPDYFSLIATHVRPNPAVNNAEGEIRKVSFFTWSAPDMSDMDAKVADLNMSEDEWFYANFPVNDNAVNNYYFDADNINIHAYASFDEESDGYLIGATTYSWKTPAVGLSQEIYIAYCQNTGFVKPTVSSLRLPSGQIDNPESTHMEGLRVSSGFPDVGVNTAVYSQGLGWLDPVTDGVYAGTMGQNRPLESISMTLSGDEADAYEVKYRVYQQTLGWSDWASNGESAGVAGQGLPLEAFEVTVDPIQ